MHAQLSELIYRYCTLTYFMAGIRQAGLTKNKFDLLLGNGEGKGHSY